MNVLGISLVSHNDFNELKKNHSIWKSFSLKGWECVVSVIDNTGEEALELWSKSNGYFYFANDYYRGFGANNNSNFNRLIRASRLDKLLIVKPDVTIELSSFYKFLQGTDNKAVVGARVIEPNARKMSSQKRSFPALLDPLVSLTLGKKLYVNDPGKSGVTDWIGGSFMLLNAEAFRIVGGFDEEFFMYYEDIDLCRRLSVAGFTVYYDSSFSFVHEAQRKGQNLFSPHFIWNLTSMIKYFKRYPTLKLLSI